MLRCWYDRPTTEVALMVDTDDDDFEDVISAWKDNADKRTDLPIGEQHTEHQSSQLKAMLQQFSDAFKDSPEKTDIVQHTIPTGSVSSIRLPLYRIPHAYRETVKQELDDMLARSIIQPKAGDWNSLLVIVKKKDGSLSLCIDYR